MIPLTPASPSSAVSIGYAAWRALTSARAANVVGVTSRGLFLLAPPQHIAFVSCERQRSPLTINLERWPDQLRTLASGATAQVADGQLFFPSIEFSVFLSADTVWHCPPAIATPRPRGEQRRTLQAIATDVLARKRSAGLAAWLPELTDECDALPSAAEPSTLLDRLIELRQAAQAGNSQQIINGLTPLLGRGRGLTPAGDDVVIGLLLMLNRWHTDRDWTGVNRAVVEAAYRGTTTISANLIECAADGQGDERLSTVADGIATGQATIDEEVDCVLDWGSSSGINALVGMAIAV